MQVDNSGMPSSIRHNLGQQQQYDKYENGESKKHVTNKLIVFEQIEHPQHGPPVVLDGITTKQRQLPGPGIRCVHADVDQVVAKPKKGYLGTKPVVVHHKMKNQDAGHDELHERTAQKHQETTKKAEEKVAGFVDDQVHVIHKGKVAPVEYEVEANRQEDQGSSPYLEVEMLKTGK